MIAVREDNSRVGGKSKIDLMLHLKLNLEQADESRSKGMLLFGGRASILLRPSNRINSAKWRHRTVYI